MSEVLRYIVDTLNKGPHNKSYTVISFDSLDTLSLLQVLNDVLSYINGHSSIDLREEPLDHSMLRILAILKVLNYKPKEDVGEGMNTFRQGLVKGEKLIIYPLLAWLLERSEELKKRAYLGRYLVRIEVPLEYQQDEVVEETYQNYQGMIEHFKELHKAVEYEKSSEYSTSDVRNDIESMEEEKKQLQRQLERLKRRVESYPQHKELLGSAQELRREREKGEELKKAKQEQKELLIEVQQREGRLARELEQAKEISSGLTADMVITKAKEENNLLHIMTHDNLPKKIEAKRSKCLELERVLTEPVMSELDLDVIRQRIEEVNNEIHELMNKSTHDESGQENVGLFRQQASLISHKRQITVERMESLMDERSKVQEELQQRKKQLDDMGGVKLIREEEFKKYIDHLRVLSDAFKRKKGEMSVYRAEYGVLSRTEEILKSKDDNIQGLLEFMERKRGVSGYRGTQENIEHVSQLKSQLDAKKEQTLHDMSRSVQELKGIIEDKKTVLAPLIKAVRPLRQKHQEIKSIHTERKATYDSQLAGLAANRSQLERQVSLLWNECIEEEREYHLITCQLEAVRLHDTRVKFEVKAMVSKDPSEKKKSIRDQLTRKIHEQENLGRALRDKQKDVKSTHEFSLRQVKMWSDLERLFRIKKQVFQRVQEEKQRVKEIEELNTTDDRLQIN